MKKFTIILLFLSICSPSFTQSLMWEEGEYLTDSIIQKNSFYEFGEHVSKKEVYKYNLFNEVKVYEFYTNTHGFFEDVEWKKIEKTNYTYNGQGKLVKLIRKKRAINTEEWTNEYKSEITFEGNDSIQTSFEWIENDWKQGARWVYTWNPENIESLSLWQIWNMDIYEWENVNRFDTIYTVDGMFDTIKYFIWFSQAEMDTGFIESYNYMYYPDTIISYYNENNVINIIKKYYDPDLKANIEYTARQINSTNNSHPLYKRIFYLDDYLNIIRDDIFSWNIAENQWELNNRIDYNYNDDNLLVERILYAPGSTTVVFMRRVYEYNSELVLSKQIVYHYPIDPDIYEKYEYYYSFQYVDMLESAIERRIIAYPNPTQGLLIIDNSKFTYHHCLIYDLSGRLIINDKLYQEDETVDISDLPPGSYVMILQGTVNTSSQQILKIK